MTPHRIALAMNVSMEAHWTQVRKYTGDPYWLHCLAVYNQVKAWGGSEDMLCAALLHDTLEDTKLTEYRLWKAFGGDVLELVIELTDEYTHEAFPELNRDERKKREAARIGACSLEARVIKLADMNDNTTSIVAHDPKFAAVYLAEKARVLSLIGDPLAEWRTKCAA